MVKTISDVNDNQGKPFIMKQTNVTMFSPEIGHVETNDEKPYTCIAKKTDTGQIHDNNRDNVPSCVNVNSGRTESEIIQYHQASHEHLANPNDNQCRDLKSQKNQTIHEYMSQQSNAINTSDVDANPKLRPVSNLHLIHPSVKMNPVFPSESLASPNHSKEPIALRLPQQLFQKDLKVEMLLIVNPHLVRKYILENPMILDEFIELLQLKMIECISKERLLDGVWEKHMKSLLMDANQFNFRYNSMNKEGNSVTNSMDRNDRNRVEEPNFDSNFDSSVSSVHVLEEGTFHYFFQLYMKLINWFNKERQEVKSNQMKEIISKLLHCEKMKHYYFEYLDHLTYTHPKLASKGNLDWKSNTFLDTLDNSWIEANLVAQMYQTLMCSRSLSLFTLYNELEIIFFQNLPLETFFTDTFYQNALFYHSYVRKVNVMEIIEQEAKVSMSKKDFKWLQTILSPTIFHPLQPFVFISSFEIFNYDIISIEKVYNILFHHVNNKHHSNEENINIRWMKYQYSVIPSLQNACSHLSHILTIGKWVVNNISNNTVNDRIFKSVYNSSSQDMSPEIIGGLVMKEAIQSSVILAIAPWIPTTDAKVLEALIAQLPAMNKDTQTSHIDVLYCYKAMKSLITGIQFMDDNEVHVENFIHYLSQVSTMRQLFAVRDALVILLDPHSWSQSNHFTSTLGYILQGLLKVIQNIELNQISSIMDETEEASSMHSQQVALQSTIKDLLWRISNGIIKEETNIAKAIKQLFQSPENLILNSLRENNMQFAEKIFGQYYTVLNEKQNQEYQSAITLYKTEKEGTIPQNEDKLLDSFFVLNDRITVLQKLHDRYPDKLWIKKLQAATKMGISPEDAVSYFFTLYYLLPNEEEPLQRYFQSRSLSKEIIEIFTKLTFGDTITSEQLHTLIMTLKNILQGNGYLPNMLEYISRILETSEYTLGVDFLNRDPEQAILDCLLREDLEVALKLTQQYAIDLFTILLTSSIESIPQAALEYFDKESKVLGLFLRIFMCDRESNSYWENIRLFCQSHFPHLLQWIDLLQGQSVDVHVTSEVIEEVMNEDKLVRSGLMPKELQSTLFKNEFTIHKCTERIEYHEIFMVTDVLSAYMLFKKYYESWTIDESIDALRYFFFSLYSLSSKNRLRSRMKSNPLLLEILVLLRKMILIKKLTQYIPDEWPSIYKKLHSEPKFLIETLISQQSFELAQEVLQICDSTIDPQLCHIVRARQALNILKRSDETETLKFFEDFSNSDALEACKIALNDATTLQHQLFFCQYINSTLHTSLSNTLKVSYSKHFLTLKVLSLLDDKSYEVFYPKLKERPELIIENLLMQARIEEVAIILDQLPQLQDDNLLIAHAIKALSVEKQSEVWRIQYVWGIDERRDKRIRRWHTYDQAPSIILTKKILNLVTGAGVAGESLLNLSLDISKLPGHHFPSRYEQLQLVDHVLSLSKTCFLKDPDGHEFIPTYDTLKMRLELLKKIYNADCNIKIFLPDLSKQSKARRIRDSLMEEDQMELALEVATICHVEREPVWIEWGLSLLSLGMYSEAREKLKQCTVLPPTQRHQLLARIIQKLGSPSVTRHKQLLSKHSDILNHQLELKETVKRLREQSPETIFQQSRQNLELSAYKYASRVDDQGCNEVRYYCELLGNPNDYLNFLIKQGSYLEAVAHTLTNQISQTVFVKIVVVHCHRHGLLSKLYETISNSSLSTQSNLLRPYWTAACKYFDQKEAIHLLYELQSFMKDEARCGLTCIRLYREDFTNNGPLHLAKSHFSKALQLSATDIKPVLSPEEIANYMQATNFQLEFFQYPLVIHDIAEEKLDLYGSEKKKTKIAKILLKQAPQLAIRIINAYNLPPVKLYSGILRDFAINKKFDAIKHLLQNSLLTLRSHDKDLIIEALIYAHSQEMQDIKSAEKHISKLTSDTAITRAWLHCHNYKKAFSSATKNGSITQLHDVQMILRHLDKDSKAGKEGAIVKKQCELWMKSHGQ